MAISNDEIIARFKKIEYVKNSKDHNAEEQIENIQNSIVQDLSFLVYNVSRQYSKFSNYEDLIQEGFIGLLKAARRFDYNKFPNFFVYAEQWIKHNIKRAASRFDIVYSPDRKRVVYAELDNDSENEEECVESPEDTYFLVEMKTKVEEVLKDFSERDREIVKRIFGLGDKNPQTLREIGPDFNLTYERVRQIKNNVLLKLKKNQVINDLF